VLFPGLLILCNLINFLSAQKTLTPSGASADSCWSSQFTSMWNITGTRIHTNSRGSEPWAQGSLIPGANYSAQVIYACLLFLFLFDANKEKNEDGRRTHLLDVLASI